VKQPFWILPEVIYAIHDMQLAEHGGASGVRDAGLLESALARPVNQHGYGETDICCPAAAYAFGIIRNHPFVDGNKRTGFLSACVFLKINGFDLIADEVETTTAVLAIASGEKGEAQFGDWLRARAYPARSEH
jgi:death on curing protein